MEGGEDGLANRKAGRKPLQEARGEVERLQQKVTLLEEKLHRANLIIEAQKKVSCLLAEALGNAQNG